MRQVLTATGLLLALPATAHGATLVREKAGFGDFDYRYEAGPGEVNAPEISITDKVIRVFDPGATIEAPEQCTASGNEVSCPGGDVASFAVVLGDGDDRLEHQDAHSLSRVDGGPGDDVLAGAFRLLLGGEGDDTLSSTEQSGMMSGGPGADGLTAAGESMVLQGGPDADTLRAAKGASFTASFADAAERVTADLSKPGPMGPEEQPDDVAGAHGVIGGSGDDLLRGDGEDNDLQGGAGDDSIAGAGGRDDIRPGTGSDQVDGGGGRDAIRDAREHQPTPNAVLEGGGGGDLVAGERSGAVLLGGGGRDVMRFGKVNANVDGGAGDDLMTPRDPLSDSEGVVCGDGSKDAASNFGRAPAPADCEHLRIVDGGQDVVFPNRVAVDGRRLRIPTPNICLRPCELELGLFLGNRPSEETTLSLDRGEDLGTAVMELSAKSLRRIREAGFVRIYFEARGVQKIGDAFATFGNVAER